MNNNNSKSTGVGFCGLLFLVFLVLKLAKIGAVADWDWWWVTSPLWIPTAIVIAIIILYVIVMISIGK